jgi:hypothetical protein
VAVDEQAAVVQQVEGVRLGPNSPPSPDRPPDLVAHGLGTRVLTADAESEPGRDDAVELGGEEASELRGIPGGQRDVEPLGQRGVLLQVTAHIL